MRALIWDPSVVLVCPILAGARRVHDLFGRILSSNLELVKLEAAP